MVTPTARNMKLQYTVEPVLRDHYHERPPVLKDRQVSAESPTFQCKWTCHQKPPVLRDHIFMANGAVFQYRFYCIPTACTAWMKIVSLYMWVFNVKLQLIRTSIWANISQHEPSFGNNSRNYFLLKIIIDRLDSLKYLLKFLFQMDRRALRWKEFSLKPFNDSSSLIVTQRGGKLESEQFNMHDTAITIHTYYMYM